MIPYATFPYFLVIGALLIPSVIAGLKGKRIIAYNDAVSVIMMLVIFANTPYQLLSLILFILWQSFLIKGYLFLRQKNNKTSYFYSAVVLAIVPLFIVKLAPHAPALNTFGFLGISYVSFKSIQMIMDIRDHLLKTIPLGHLLRFITFFPTISSGPIDRYRRFEKDMSAVPSASDYRGMLYQGLNKIFLGFLYKFIIGYLVHKYWMQSPALHPDAVFSIWMYMYAYSMYLFFDFAGYSNFAIGVSYLLGVKTPENFNKPFLSRNIKDFWNRWHMTLSFWFRDYIYMRFVFTAIKNKWMKDRYLISYIGLFLNFMVMGFWHGFFIQYIIYGLYHAIMFVSFDIFERINKKHKFWPKNSLTHAFSVVLTFHVICFSFLIFSGRLNFLL